MLGLGFRASGASISVGFGDVEFRTLGLQSPAKPHLAAYQKLLRLTSLSCKDKKQELEHPGSLKHNLLCLPFEYLGIPNVSPKGSNIQNWVLWISGIRAVEDLGMYVKQKQCTFKIKSP